MAIFQSGILTKASGSLGGLTFSRNKGGNYIKARSNPTNPGSPQQTAIRVILADLSNRWSNTLTQADRNKWDDYAANVPVTNNLGEQIFLTGLNHYVRSNTPRGQADGSGITLPRVDAGPANFTLGSFSEVSVTASAATNALSIAFINTDDWANEDDAGMIIWTARPKQASIKFFKGPYRFNGAIPGDGTVPPTSPAAAFSAFAFEEGQKIFGRVRVTSADGRLSADQRWETIAAA